MKGQANKDYLSLTLSSAVLCLFIVLSIVYPHALSHIIEVGYHQTEKVFGKYWQMLMLANFGIAIALSCSKLGRLKLGGSAVPEMGRFKWISIILCTLIAAGGVFWAAAEPIAHYIQQPPFFTDTMNNNQRVIDALAQTYLHWGFLAWAILGSLCTIVFMYVHHAA